MNPSLQPKLLTRVKLHRIVFSNEGRKASQIPTFNEKEVLNYSVINYNNKEDNEWKLKFLKKDIESWIVGSTS